MIPFSLTIKTNKGPISINWDNGNDLRYWSELQHIQAGNMKHLSFKIWSICYHIFNQDIWRIRESIGAFDISDNSKIIDIGSGLSVIDLVLNQYVKNCDFYLIDKNQYNTIGNTIYSENNYPFYNSWNPVIDAILASKYDRERFNLLDITDIWPNNVDLIMSNYSWLWHYPSEEYWHKVKSSLKVNGKLLLTIRLLKDNNIIDLISNEFGNLPIMIPHYTKNQSIKEQQITSPDPYKYGYTCLWTRKNK